MPPQPATPDFATISFDEAQAFCEAEDGAILPIVGVSLAVFLGLVALSYDLGRLASTQSELQSFADHVALAAAGELDGRTDSIIRAEDAAATLIQDTQTFGEGGPDLDATSYTISFHATLPDSDLDAMTSPTSDPEQAAYVRVTANPRTVRYTFARAFNALTGRDGPNQGEVGAVAVAGFTQYACDITPLMFCLPDDGGPLPPGTMMQAQAGGGSGSWDAGNWGWLSPSGSGYTVDPEGPCADEPEGQVDRCLLAAQSSITTCFAQRGVDMDPGRSIGVTEAAINTRFDIWASTMSGARNNLAYAPAPNTISGLPRGNNQCVANNADPDDSPIQPLPRDECFPNCPRGRIGNGEFRDGLADYYEANYGDAASDWAPLDPVTRYEVYLAEIDQAGGAGSTDDILPEGSEETGRGNQCSDNQSSDVERRVLVMAGIDCSTTSFSGSATGVPVEEFYRVFITEPAGEFNLWLEVLGSASDGGDGSTIHDVVQLYR